MPEEAGSLPPETHADENDCESDELSDLDADVEGEKIGHEPVLGNLIFKDLGCQAETMEETEDQGGELCVRLVAAPALECAEIIKCLVDDRQADDHIDQVGADVPTKIDAEQHRGGVADRKQVDIDADVFQPVEKEDNPEKKQKVIVSGHHMFRARDDPGHSKSILATYLMLRGRLVSLALSFTHVTVSVVIALFSRPLVSIMFGGIGAGSSPILELVSRSMLGVIGIWMLWSALFREPHSHTDQQGIIVGLSAGLIPCPLTLFVMTFAISRGVPEAGI